MEHAEREEERVDALLFEAHLRLVCDTSERLVEVFRGRGSLQKVVRVPGVQFGGRVRDKVGRRAVVFDFVTGSCVGSCRGRGGRGLNIFGLRRRGEEAHLPLPQVEEAEHLRRLLVHDGDGRDLVRLEIQGAVALAHVQKLALPVADCRRDPLVLIAPRRSRSGGFRWPRVMAGSPRALPGSSP